MNKNFVYIDPLTKERLLLQSELIVDKEIISGMLIANDGNEYKITDGIPDFRCEQNSEWLEYYENNAQTYDDYNHITFILQEQDENETRKKTISKLNIKHGDKILEIGCGTGRDSVIISNNLGDSGELFLADISESMIKKCKEKLSNRKSNTNFLLADASFLPFPDNYFDKSFSFVVLPAVADKSLFLKELARVTKTGGKIVVGSEGIIPSLKNTLFGKLILNNCSLYGNDLPLADIPVNARNVKIEWILNGIIFLLEFDIAEKEPELMNIQIPGKRGGTLYTRYFGKLEGISSETKDFAQRALKKSNLSNYEWLNNAVTKAAKELIKNE